MLKSLALAFFCAHAPLFAQTIAGPASLGPGTPAAALAQIKTGLFSDLTSFSPEFGNELGLKECAGGLCDLSAPSISGQVAYLESTEAGLSAIPAAELSAQDRIDRSVMLSVVRGQLHSWRDNKEYQTNVGLMLQPYNVVQDQLAQAEGAPAGWEAALSRISAIPAYLAQARQHMRQALREGKAPNKRVLEADGIAAAEAAAEYFSTGLSADVETLPFLTRDRFSGRAAAAGAEAAAAYRETAEFLKNEVLPRARESFALGAAEYAWHLKNDFGIDVSPAELNAQGLALAEALRLRMETMAKRLFPDKTLPEAMAELAKEHPKDDRALFETYARVSDRARDFVTKEGLFTLPADYKLKILATPPGARATVSIAAYIPAPPLDASKKGAFLVTPTEGSEQKLGAHSYSRLASVVVHEAFPGHDLQFYAFQRQKSVSPVRYLLQMSYAASLNIEGYALYAEELMRSHGFFSPKEELAQLNMQLWRAWRVVVDTALHTGTMSYAEAAKTLEEKAFLPAPIAAAEAYRYASIPTQAITYMLGRLQIEALKAQYKEIKGDAFSEAEFHEKFLGFGPVQPSLIAPVMLDEARRERAAGAGR